MEVDTTNDDEFLTKAQVTELHASIKAAQERWGISYKDAAHRLYLQKMAQVQAEMAEVERLKAMMARCRWLINETIRRHSDCQLVSQNVGLHLTSDVQTFWLDPQVPSPGYYYM
ncbi:hypothetical protein BDN71DRAFT_1432912 [Pleurotus eryngii]|uniref:Uncharacterized protein n=1 Tax=Pleurotus eryngii TaxID=5323 RepID=A0A9P5ZTH1_PLEER|nr:hypothetical protein BDN71DRAFT_1432912 [Pleurotus eryngii]